MTRFWREEREDGAIYNAYLKKVTYHTLSEVSAFVRFLTGPERSMVAQ